VWIAPAMESGMWEHPATRESLALLRSRGVGVVMPDAGHLASGRAGIGRMAEPAAIREAVLRALARNDYAGVRVLVTAGPTREAFDPVRFITNASSGKMGYAVARMAARRGAEVCLVSGPVELAPPPGVERVTVRSTEDMLDACRTRLADHDVWIMAAAPADYRPVHFSPRKLKKGELSGTLHGELEPTPDILATLRSAGERAVVVGFAAETHDLVEHARDKLASKGLDLIVANDVTRTDAGFGADTNAVTLLGADGSMEELPVMSKDAVADALLDRVAALRAARS